MIVCLCNGLNERELRAAAAGRRGQGVGELFRAMGCRVRCGKCVPYVVEIAREARPDPVPGEDRAAAGAVAEAA